MEIISLNLSLGGLKSSRRVGWLWSHQGNVSVSVVSVSRNCPSRRTREAVRRFTEYNTVRDFPQNMSLKLIQQMTYTVSVWRGEEMSQIMELNEICTVPFISMDSCLLLLQLVKWFSMCHKLHFRFQLVPYDWSSSYISLCCFIFLTIFWKGLKSA